MGNTEVGPTSCFGDLVAITVYSHMYLNFKLVLDPSGERPLGENSIQFQVKPYPRCSRQPEMYCYVITAYLAVVVNLPSARTACVGTLMLTVTQV